MQSADVLVIGGGIAGLSVAARLASQARVVVLEGESAPGYHASGRSVAFAHYGLGNEPVRTLTALSMAELAAHGSVHPALPLPFLLWRQRMRSRWPSRGGGTTMGLPGMHRACQVAALVFCTAAAVCAQTWRAMGPPGGDVRSLASDPRNPRQLYLGTSDGHTRTQVRHPTHFSWSTSATTPSEWMTSLASTVAARAAAAWAWAMDSARNFG